MGTIQLNLPPVFHLQRTIYLFLFICFGMGAWAVWSCAPQNESEIFVTVEHQNLPTGLSISNLTGNRLKVRVRGPKAALTAFSADNPKYTLDLSSSEIGIQTIPIDPARLSLPVGTTFISAAPDAIVLTIEKKMTKQVPVVLSMVGQTAPGFEVTAVITDPETITLSGPETLLLPIEKVSTKSVDVAGLSESFKKEIALNLAGPVRSNLPGNIVTAEISIGEKWVEKTFNQIEVEGKGSAYQFKIHPPTIRIVTEGPENNLDRLRPDEQVEVVVDLADLEPGEYVRYAAIKLPEKIMLVDAKPKFFTVQIYDQEAEPRDRQSPRRSSED